MAQNRSAAVMAQRQEARDSLDDFPTPPWAARALCEYLTAAGIHLDRKRCWEPAANRGYMVRPLSEYFELVYGSDAHDYGAGYQVRDFLMPYRDEVPRWDWIVTNPPYRLGLEFAQRALDVATDGVALFLRTQWAEGEDRYQALFARPWQRPTLILQFSERVPLFKGIVRRKGDKYLGLNKAGEPVEKRAETATSYAWFVWLRREHRGHTGFDWMPPCRKLLERPGDYDQAGAA